MMYLGICLGVALGIGLVVSFTLKCIKEKEYQEIRRTLLNPIMAIITEANERVVVHYVPFNFPSEEAVLCIYESLCSTYSRNIEICKQAFDAIEKIENGRDVEEFMTSSESFKYCELRAKYSTSLQQLENCQCLIQAVRKALEFRLSQGIAYTCEWAVPPKRRRILFE